MSVTEWLSEAARLQPRVNPDDLGSILRELDAVATEVAAGIPPGNTPLRAPKGRLASVLRCERLAVATLDATHVLDERAAMGRLVDRLVALRLRDALEDPVGASARAHLAADPDEELEEVAARHALLDALDEPAMAIRRELGDLSAWWPRTQVPVTLALADDRVLASARLDVELGGPGTGLPGVILEVKSGAVAADHRHDLYLYALLAASRRGAPPPVALATWYVGGGFAPIELTTDVVSAAADRLAEGLRRLGHIAAGGAPGESPGRWCRWCPVVDVCGTSRPEEPSGEDDLWDPDRWDTGEDDW